MKAAKPSKKGIRKSVPRRKSSSLAELNSWMSADYDRLLSHARKNCIRLTGRPTFGGTIRRKSA